MFPSDGSNGEGGALAHWRDAAADPTMLIVPPRIRRDAVASLLVALTVTPAPCNLLLLGRLGGKHGGDGPLVRVLKRAYEPAQRWSLRRRGTVFLWSLVPTVAAGLGATAFGTSLLPTSNGGTCTAFLFQPPRTPLDESDRAARGAESGLRDVADLTVERTPNLIARENARRKAVVSCNVADGSNLGDLVAEVRRIADPIVARADCYAVYGGQFEAQQSALKTLGTYGVAALLLMLLLLQASTGSYRTALLVMVNLPLALIGGVVAVFVAESPSPWENLTALLGAGGAYRPPVLSLPSLVGFFTLFGIAVRNGILLVNHYRHVEEHEGRSGVEAIVHGSMERLVPILMTALTAALGLIPLAAAAGEPGSELLAPLSIVVLGGLVSSTFLNLIVVPAGYAWLHRRKAASSGDPS